MGLTRKTPLRNKAPMKAARKRKCRECREWYQPGSTTQKACSIRCAQAIARQELAKKQAREAAQAKRQAKAERAERRKRKQELKTKSQWCKEAQQAFNAYVRERDRGDPCICCGRWGADESWKPGGQWDAGHYLSVGSHPELRFDEANCHKQLKSCNAGEGKYARKRRTVGEEYRERLIKKIGLGEVERLEGPNEPKRYRIEDYQAIKAHYQKKLKTLKSERYESV